jgi:hypothetical protein
MFHDIDAGPKRQAMSDLDVVLRGTLARFHRNACCPEAAGAELDSFVKQIKALFGARDRSPSNRQAQGPSTC